MESFCGTEFWNISKTWETTDPDFTKCFQDTVFVWVPVIFLWFLSPWEIYSIYISTAKPCPWSWKNVLKLCITSLLVILQVVILIVNGVLYQTYQQVDYVTSIILILTFLLNGILIFFNKKKGRHTSGILFLYWLLTALAGIPKYRSLFIHPYLYANITDLYFISYVYVYYPLVALMFLAHILADDIYKEDNFKKDRKESPELKASFLSYLFFSWFDSMAWLGYRKPLETRDLWNLNPDDSSEYVVPKFEKEWKKSFNRIKRREEKRGNASSKKKQASILGPMWRVFSSTFLFGSFCKLVQDLLTFVQPQILNLLIGYIENGEEMWKGYFYAALMFVTAAAQSLFLARYFMTMNMIAIRIRTSLISAIYKKSLLLSSKTRKDTTVGEIVNLMSVDAQRFVDLMPNLNLLWSAPLQIVLALYFLWNIIGAAVLAGLAMMIILIPVNAWVATKQRSLQIRQMKFKDERVKLMNEIISGIKVLKLYAWEPSFEKIILQIRAKEEKILKNTAYLSSFTYFIFVAAPFLVSLFSFLTYIYMDENNVLDAKTAFVSLSLFNILRFPLMMFPMLISYLVQTFVSIGRINKFLNFDEIDPENVLKNSEEKDPIIIENGNFAWEEEDNEGILKEINLRVKKGSLVTIVGAVGSGKSSLMSALLGEMEKLSGRVNILGSVAYVSQQAWIQNATLQDNILFGSKLNEKIYSEVVEACALEQDLAMLPAGDKTEIGEKGINLSGGQKQRVSLARAVYNDADLYLLDDPLSAVDSHVGKHIFEKVIGPSGILKNKTRILVTHNISYLPNTDQIFVLKDGKISENGTYKELLERKGAFAEFLLQHLTEKGPEDSLNEINEIKYQIESAINSPELKTTLMRMVSRISEMSEQSQEDSEFIRKNSVRSSTRSKASPRVSTSKTNAFTKGEKLIEEEIADIGNIKLKTFTSYLISAGIFLLFTTILFNIVYQVFSIGSNVWLSYWSDGSKNNKTVDNDFYIGIYGALGVAQVIALIPANLALSVGCIYASSRLHHNMLQRTLHNPMSFFDTVPIGRLINRFSKDVDILDNIIIVNMRSWISCFFSVIGTIAIISYNYILFLAVIFPTAIIYYLIQRFFVRTSRQLKRIESITRSPIYSHFNETITGASIIRAYGVQKRFYTESEAKVDFNQMCYYPNIIANRWLAVRLEMIGNILIFFASLFAVLNRDVDTGTVGLTVSYALSITQTLNWLVRMTSDVETNIVAVERIKEYGETVQEAVWDIPETAPPKSWPSDGVVEFKDFSVRYREGLDLVLNKVSFKIKSGEKVGIVGRTGAGKSSLTLCLFRIIEAAEGAIFIDDVNISKIGLHQLRSKLTIIPQDPVLFSGTLRLNLDPFSTFEDEELWRALEHAYLSDFVKNLPAGLSHVISEGGENLSVGQRQLICLARALLRKTKVLILDEATAAVDLETDDLIQTTIRKEFKECTILTIAHRLNTILDSDRVIVLDKGLLKEYDSPENLLKNEETIFYGMAKDAGLV